MPKNLSDLPNMSSTTLAATPPRALSNDRILSAHNEEVTFSYRDRKNEDRKKDH